MPITVDNPDSVGKEEDRSKSSTSSRPRHDRDYRDDHDDSDRVKGRDHDWDRDREYRYDERNNSKCSCCAHYYQSQSPSLVVKENWVKGNWRPIAAGIYLFICIFDFVLMPTYTEWTNTRFSPHEMSVLATQFDGGSAQVEALRILQENRVWQPLTLKESGLLHLSFGAILGAAAWTRGREKIARIR